MVFSAFVFDTHDQLFGWLSFKADAHTSELGGDGSTHPTGIAVPPATSGTQNVSHACLQTKKRSSK